MTVDPGEKDAAEIRLEKTRSGETTVFIGGKALHSRFDPVKEAAKAAASVPSDAGIVVLGGFGLGYVAEALAAAAPERLLIVAEADGRLPEIAAKVRDLGGLLGRPNVVLMAGGSPEDVRGFLTGGPAVGAGIHYLPWRPSAETDPEWYSRLGEVVEMTAERRRVNARTLERFGRRWVRNLAANADVLARALSLDPIAGRFEGVPALVVAGGPSLDEYAPLLPDLALRHLIIVVDTALPGVLRAGMKPDIVAAVDPQYWNARHLDRCRDGAGDALVLAESATHPLVFRSLDGRPLLSRTRFPLGTILEDAAGIRGELKAGGSVATAAWDLARRLGCSPITAVGLDLGFPGNRTHYNGSLSRERPHLLSSRTAPAEEAFFRALRDAGARAVESADGGTVLTDARMDVYAAWFTESAEALADRDPSVLGGAGRRIPGIRVITEKEIAARPIRRDEINAVLRGIKDTVPVEGAAKAVKGALRKIGKALSDIEDLARRGLEASRKAAENRTAGREFSASLSEMEEIDGLLLAGEGRGLISFLIQPIILELSARSGSPDPLEDSRRLYGEIAESAAFHLDILGPERRSGEKKAQGKDRPHR